MSYSYDDYYYIDLAGKAREIAEKIGKNIIREDYYTDFCIGKSYVFDKLEITFYDIDNNQSILISINNNKVLEYDFNSEELDYSVGHWTDLIEALYDKVPDIIYSQNEKQRKIREKIDKLDELNEYFKKIIIYSKEKGFLERLRSNLGECNISIKKSSYYPLSRNLVTGDYEESSIATTTYEIYHYSSLVAKFRDNQFDTRYLYYRDDFKDGYWVEDFKGVITETIEAEKDLIQKEVDNSASEMIKKLKRGY